MKHTLDCTRCGGQHEFEIDLSSLTSGQRDGREPLSERFTCPNIALMYRQLGFGFDAGANSFKSNIPDEHRTKMIQGYAQKWGTLEIDQKIKRYRDLNLVFMGTPQEYFYLLMDTINTYCCGYFFPAMTGAGGLGERLLNVLTIQTRGYFKGSPLYKKLHRQQSFDNWVKPIEALNAWGVISSNVAEHFEELNKYRNNAVHYNPNYDYEANSHGAVQALGRIIKDQFDAISRRDIFWVFDVPGELWVRSSMIEDPFVKEFILPHCLLLTPYCEPMVTPPMTVKNSPLKPLSDQEFIELRKNKADNKTLERIPMNRI